MYSSCWELFEDFTDRIAQNEDELIEKYIDPAIIEIAFKTIIPDEIRESLQRAPDSIVVKRTKGSKGIEGNFRLSNANMEICKSLVVQNQS